MAKNNSPIKTHMTVRDWDQGLSTQLPFSAIQYATANVKDYGVDEVQIAGGTYGQLKIKEGWNPFEFASDMAGHFEGHTKTALWRNECGLSVTRQPLDVLKHIMKRYAESGVDRLDNFHHANDHRLMNAIPLMAREIEQESDGSLRLQVAAGVTLQSNPNTMAQKQAKIDDILFELDKCLEAGHEGAYIKNANGKVYPDFTHDVIEAINERFDVETRFHTHNAYGYAYQNAIAAMHAGVTGVDGLAPGMAEGVSQLDFVKLHHIAEQEGGSLIARLPDINIEAMEQDAAAAFLVRMLHSQNEVRFDPEFLQAAEMASVPGGAMTSLASIPGYMENLERALGVSDRQEIAKIVYKQEAENEKRLGYPTGVTPAQNIKDVQAGLDVVNKADGRGQPLEQLAPGTLNYLTGQLGKVSGDVDPELQKKALQQAGLDAVTTPPAVAEGIADIQSQLSDQGIDSPTLDEAVIHAMNPKLGIDLIKQERGNTLRDKDELRVPLTEELHAVCMEDGEMEPYADLIAKIAFSQLDLTKMQNGHYDGVDYQRKFEKGEIEGVSADVVEQAAEQYPSLDFSSYEDKLKRSIKQDVLQLKQRLQDHDADGATVRKANGLLKRVSNGLGADISALPVVGVHRFPSEDGSKFANKRDWNDHMAAPRVSEEERQANAMSDSWMSSAWGEPKRLEQDTDNGGRDAPSTAEQVIEPD